MPYIKQERRDPGFWLDKTIEPGKPNAGDLNYQLTMACKHYLHEKGVSYQAINDIIGALEGAKLEFYRRIAEPYEDIKIAQNGDVY